LEKGEKNVCVEIETGVDGKGFFVSVKGGY
jgi:hypothetical protein